MLSRIGFGQGKFSKEEKNENLLRQGEANRFDEGSCAGAGDGVAGSGSGHGPGSAGEQQSPGLEASEEESRGSFLGPGSPGAPGGGRKAEDKAGAHSEVKAGAP